MTFTLINKQTDVQYMFKVIVALSLFLIQTVVSGTQQKSDICQVIKTFYLQILRHHKTIALKEIISQTEFVFQNVCFEHK